MHIHLRDKIPGLLFVLCTVRLSKAPCGRCRSSLRKTDKVRYDVRKITKRKRRTKYYCGSMKSETHLNGAESRTHRDFYRPNKILIIAAQFMGGGTFSFMEI
jgi:hypothetical protein